MILLSQRRSHDEGLDLVALRCVALIFFSGGIVIESPVSFFAALLLPLHSYPGPLGPVDLFLSFVSLSIFFFFSFLLMSSDDHGPF